MNNITANEKLTDKEDVKDAKRVIKQMFKQIVFALIISILTIFAIIYIILGQDENLKILFWTILLLMNISALLSGIKTTVKTKDYTWFIYTMILVIICILIMFRIFGMIDNTIAVVGFIVLTAVATIFFFRKQKGVCSCSECVIFPKNAKNQKI